MFLKSLVVLGMMGVVSQNSSAKEPIEAPAFYSCHFYLTQPVPGALDKEIASQDLSNIILPATEGAESYVRSFNLVLLGKKGEFRAKVNTVHELEGSGIGVEISYISPSKEELTSSSSQGWGSSYVNAQLRTKEFRAFVECDLNKN